MNDASLGSQAPWSGSDKFQDPNDINCDGDWTGFAARFARNAGQANEFYPNKNAIMSQVVGPVNGGSKDLAFHFLFVAHRFNRLKAEIYGSSSPNGPWTSVWIPFDEQNCLAKDCANAPYNQFCMADRTCLWDYVTAAYLGSSTSALTKSVSQGYPYYKIAFLMNYPEPDNTSTGDVGGKIVRVYFAVNGETGGAAEIPKFSPGAGEASGIDAKTARQIEPIKPKILSALSVQQIVASLLIFSFTLVGISGALYLASGKYLKKRKAALKMLVGSLVAVAVICAVLLTVWTN